MSDTAVFSYCPDCHQFKILPCVCDPKPVAPAPEKPAEPVPVPEATPAPTEAETPAPEAPATADTGTKPAKAAK